MSIDQLQDKIRKSKNPSILDLALMGADLPPHLLEVEGSVPKAYQRFCRELLNELKGTVCAVRVSFTAFAIMGPEGLEGLQAVLKAAKDLGYYVVLEAPYILSPMMASAVADAVFGNDAIYPCDGLIIDSYPGSDVIRPFLPYVQEQKKDLFPVVRTSNKSAPEIQDLLSGSRLVHAAAADQINRFGADVTGKFGYARVSVLAGANSPESLKALRAKYPRLFLLVDDMDYSGCNAKNCANAFDKFGHGAAVCAGPTITHAWKEAGSDGSDYLEQALSAAQRMKKNLTRYTTIM
jgi:orotidine-5'-phosphate decarboxylase